MDTGNQSFLKQLGVLWARIGPGQQMIVVSLALILIVAFAIWIGVARQPDWALLYGGLEPTDAGQIIGELQGQEVPYKLKDSGKSILVPADRVDELRISLATGGFTPSGATGYELLDRTQLGLSDFLQRTNRSRAIEGELARTLMSLQEVRSARVHLTLPEPTPFIAEQAEPAASVVLLLSPPGATLDRAKVAAVRTLVAGAIGTRNFDNITIIDQNMNLLTGPQETQPGALLPSQEEARRNYELQRGADIRMLLERAFGIGKVAVSFSCIMNFDQVQSESLQYEPIQGTEHGVLVSEEGTETSSSGQNTTGGVPGTESNIPSYPAATGQPTESNSATETKNYEVSSTHETRVMAPGTLTSQSVSVLIDSTGRDANTLASDKTEAEKLVAAAAGINTTTGDVVTVSFRQFDTSLQQDLAQGQKSIFSSAMWQTAIRWIIVALAFGVLIWVISHFMKPLEGSFVGVPAMATATREVDLPPVELPMTDPAALEQLRIREEIERLIREDPSAAAKVVKTWLQE
jgi:flagellar M-ring protein FliF